MAWYLIAKFHNKFFSPDREEQVNYYARVTVVTLHKQEYEFLICFKTTF